PRRGPPWGYAELFDHFEGRHDLATAMALSKRNSRRLAKSQMTWFRKFDCSWVAMREGRSLESVADEVSALWEKRLGGGPNA
ncbi:MAG: hypothetical protein V1918_01095, partial [Planctomycetota bacterium]